MPSIKRSGVKRKAASKAVVGSSAAATSVDGDTPPRALGSATTPTRFAAPPARKRRCVAFTPSPPTTGRSGERFAMAASASGSQDESPPNKRACKRDLRQHLRVNELVFVPHVDQALLDKYNGGQPICARFTGDRFFDTYQQKHYRSLSSWVKQRLVDVRSLSPSSNISGWDRAAVRRDGRKVALRMLIDNESDEAAAEAASPFILAERMALLGKSDPPTDASTATTRRHFDCGDGDDEATSPERLLGLQQPVPASRSEREQQAIALREARERASAYLSAIESRLDVLRT